MSYTSQHAEALRDPAGFWRRQAEALEWFRFPEQILTRDADGMAHWFADGELNTAYLALDHHVKHGRGDQLALVYDSPVTDSKARFTYRELTDAVARTAGMLAALGVGYGDRVVIYLPNIPEAVIGMLAVARLGAIHSVVFGGFAAPELALRIDDAQPKVVLSASCGIEFKRIVEYKPLLDHALELAAHRPQACVIFQRPQARAAMTAGRDYDWAELLAAAQPVGWTPVRATDPLYILYTSGTTGKPKGVVREHGGHAVAVKYGMKAVFNHDPGDVVWASSDVGWVMGHSNMVYGPLLQGCTTVLYEGKPVMTPDAGAVWRVCAEYGVKVLFTAPTAFRAIKRDDPHALEMKKYDLGKLELIFSAGERLDPPTADWLTENTGKPIIDNWWQTEIGWPVAANLRGLEPMPVKQGSSSVVVPGWDLRILNDEGRELPRGTQGFIALKLPLPPSCMNRVWGDDNAFRTTYLDRFPGYYATGDGGYVDEDGYVFIMGRVDDVINVCGHRLSTGEIEQVVAAHPAVAECAVIAQNDELRGQVPLGLVVLKHGVAISEAELQVELIARVRETIGPIACYKTTVVVASLPKTRSGKIVRKMLNRLVNRLEYTVPSTIEDMAVIPQIIETLRATIHRETQPA
jgi:propionyl-CoA synthetase